jgi:CubicO group peptidase (beta-lactamase class C family)
MSAQPAWLVPALAYVEDWLGFQMRHSEQPGCALAVVHEGELVLERAFGAADLASGEALTPRHRFRVASHSKSFTAAALLKLREQGRIRLDEPAGLHVAGLHPEIAAASLAQLLSHSAGIVRDGPDCAYWVERAPFLDASALRGELADPPSIEANTRLKYSNHGFGLAGLVVEAVTGEAYGSWVQREIVEAVGLAETRFDAPLASGVPLARGHSGKTLLGRRLVFPGDQPTHALASATGFVSTAADLARFFAQLAPTAADSVLSVASRREMTRAQWKDPFAAIESSYGLGAICGQFDGWDWFGHSGGFPGYITRTLCVPAERLSICCLTNASDGLSHAWLDGVLAILKRFRDSGAPSPALADWRGRWWSLWGASDLVAVGSTVLVANPALTTPLLKATELTLAGPDEACITQAGGFANFGEPARLERDEGGEVRAVRLGGGRLVGEADLTQELTARYRAAAAAAAEA